MPALAIIWWVTSPLLVGSGKLGNPWPRMQRANASIAAMCAGVCAWFWIGGTPPGCRCWQAGYADLNAGDCALNAFLNVGEPGSGKLGSPCERMQSAKL